MLTFKRLLAQTSNRPGQRQALARRQGSRDMINTVGGGRSRSIRSKRAIHNRTAQGRIDGGSASAKSGSAGKAQSLGARESTFGPRLRRNFWMYIPSTSHPIPPFYVYGLCVWRLPGELSSMRCLRKMPRAAFARALSGDVYPPAAHQALFRTAQAVRPSTPRLPSVLGRRVVGDCGHDRRAGMGIGLT